MIRVIARMAHGLCCIVITQSLRAEYEACHERPTQIKVQQPPVAHFVRSQASATPTSVSSLNRVERFFRSLTVDVLRRSVFTSLAEREAATANYTRIHNQNPKPFM